MKKTFLFLAVAGSFALPAVTRAETPKKASAKADKVVVSRADAPVAPARQRVIFYITSTPHTGSNIPMVYRQYNGRIDSASNAAVYGSREINRTGALDVGTALYKLDPSFTTFGRR